MDVVTGGISFKTEEFKTEKKAELSSGGSSDDDGHFDVKRKPSKVLSNASNSLAQSRRVTKLHGASSRDESWRNDAGEDSDEEIKPMATA